MEGAYVVEVTQEDIDKARTEKKREASGLSCPVGRAWQRATGHPYASAGYTWLYLPTTDDWRHGPRAIYDAPRGMTEFTFKYDKGAPVHPFVFIATRNRLRDEG